MNGSGSTGTSRIALRSMPAGRHVSRDWAFICAGGRCEGYGYGTL